MAITAAFDLYYLFVEVLTGSIFWSLVLVAFIITIIGLLSRMGPWMLIYILFLFGLVAGVNYFGGIAAAAIFIFSAIYMTWSIVRFVGGANVIGS